MDALVDIDIELLEQELLAEPELTPDIVDAILSGDQNFTPPFFQPADDFEPDNIITGIDQLDEA